jgi:hypothetical protein
MEIIVYETNENVPFTKLYQEWSGYKHILFSNHQNQIEKFNQPEVKDEIAFLLEHINQDDVVFYVPSELETEFKALFNTQEWDRDDIVLEEQIKKLGLLKNNPIYQFFEKTIIKAWRWALNMKVECPKECVALLNQIIDREEDIDAVIIFDLKSDAMFCESKKSDSKVKVNIDLLINSLIKVKNATDEFSNNAENAKEYYKEYGHFYKENVGIFFFHFLNDLNLIIFFLAKSEESLIGSLSVITKEYVSDIRTYLSKRK